MRPGDFFERSGPLAWVGGMAVYCATALAGAQLLFMAVTALALGAGGAAALTPFVFTWEQAVAGGAVWQFLTYLLVNPPGLWALVQILLLGVFGREVEIRLGRQGFLQLYLAMWLAAPLLTAVAGFAIPAGPLAGSSLSNFGIFIAFTVLSPRAEIFFGLQARWVAAALLALNTMQCVAARDHAGLFALWGISAIAWFLPKWQTRPDEPGAASSPPPRLRRPKKKTAPAPAPDVHTDIDPILEKISRSGFASLTREERERLDRARASLLEKEGRRP